MSSPALPALDGANLIGIFLGSVLYGTFMSICVDLLWRWYRGIVRVPLFLLLSAVALLLSTTAFTAVFMDYLYEGLILLRDTVGPVVYYNQDRWQETTISALCIFEQALADGILVYRCWLIWNRSTFIGVVTTIPYVASILFSCLALAGASPKTELFDMFKSIFATWVHVYSGVSLGQNVLTYFLIIGRIWYTSRRATSTFGKTAFTPVIIRLLFMGGIYVLLITAILITNSLSPGGYVVIMHIWSPVSGIVFLCLIVPTTRLSTANLDQERKSSENSSNPMSTSSAQDDGLTGVPSSEFKIPLAEDLA